MQVQITHAILDKLTEEAKASPRLRMNMDLRNGPEDKSQRMLNAIEPGSPMPIHRHMKSSKTVVCLEGCLDWIFYEELPDMECGRGHDGEKVSVEANFKEVARFRVCPREKLYGIQVPKMAWHTLDVHEPSTIFESKDGAYGK